MDDAGQISSARENTAQAVEAAATEIVRHPYTKKFARLGFYTKGFLFVVIGALAILVALGDGGGELADPTGALERIARGSYGKIILLIFALGAVGHGAWNILRGVSDVDDAGRSVSGIIKRIGAGGIGVFYLFLAWKAWDLLNAAQIVGSEKIQKTLTALMLSLPLGAVLVFIVGASVAGVGLHECYSGVTGKFQETFRLHEMTGAKRYIISLLGFFSFVARGLIFALIGYFFIVAAIDSNPEEAVGLDGALLTLAQSYFGKTLLFAVAAGLICHGVLSLYEARYRQIC